jgi:hypothetical protein
MHVVLLISLVLVFANGVLLYKSVGQMKLILGNGCVAVSAFVLCSLNTEFDLGPHIEIPGWIAGLLLGGLVIVTSLITIGTWRLIDLTRRKK